MSHTWHPMAQTVSSIRPHMAKDEDGWTDHDIETEPQLFCASPAFAQEHGGPMVREMLDAIKIHAGKDIEGATIDCRTHMLMPGWYPCIPGWHLDMMPRPEGGGQPDIFNETGQYHYLCVVGSTALTQFLAEPITVPDTGTEADKGVYEQVGAHIDRQHLNTWSPQSGDIVRFGDTDWHRGRPAATSGWRWFARITLRGRRKPANKIRTQTQVYLPSVDAGW
jgi:hypothetical protein